MINAYAKFGQIMSIYLKEIDHKQNSDINYGPWLIHANPTHIIIPFSPCN